jgi:hypothetical protein
MIKEKTPALDSPLRLDIFYSNFTICYIPLSCLGVIFAVYLGASTFRYSYTSTIEHTNTRLHLCIYFIIDGTESQ